MAITKWAVDPMHSKVQFKVNHLMITTVTRYFNKFNVEAESADGQFSSASNIVFTAELNSINTNNK